MGENVGAGDGDNSLLGGAIGRGFTTRRPWQSDWTADVKNAVKKRL